MKMTFVKRAIPVIPESRISWKLGFLIFLVGGSRGGKSSLARLHLLHTVVSKGSFTHLDDEFLLAPATQWMFDPALNKAFEAGKRAKIFVYETDKVKLDSLGFAFYEKLVSHKVFESIASLCSAASKKVTEKLTSEILREWAK